MGAIVALIGLGFFAMLLTSVDDTLEIASEQTLSFATARSFLLEKKNDMMLGIGIFYAITQSGLLIWLVRYLTVQYNAETLGSTALSIYWVCATLSRFFAPRIPLRPLKVFMIGALLSCAFLVVGVFSGSPFVICVMVGIIGLVSEHCMPMLLCEIAKRQTENSALAVSAKLVSMCFMRALAPIVMGAIAAAASISRAMLLPAASGAFAGVLAFVALVSESKTDLCGRKRWITVSKMKKEDLSDL